MTETDTLPQLLESDHVGAGGTAVDTPLRSRFLLPVFVPLLSIAVVAVFVLDVSRIFLAGDEDAALAMGIALTVAILLGASLVAAVPRLSSSTVAVILAAVFVVVSLGGLVSLGHSLDDGSAATGWHEPKGAAKATVAVAVSPTKLAFDSKQYTAPAGIVRIDYSGQSGHTLAFREPQFVGFELSTAATGKHSAKIDLPPGTYTSTARSMATPRRG
jgi:hypothetical protein